MRFFAAVVAVVFPVLLYAQQVSDYPSLPSQVLSEYSPKQPSEWAAEAMAAAGQAFLASLDDERRAEAALPYDSVEKAHWTNTPPRGPQGGVRLGDLDEGQLQCACDLLAAVLSAQGYAKARNIPLADDRLLRNGQRRPGFGAEDYWLAVFGQPSATEPWALQFDGHHLAINLAFHGERMSMSPTFIGTQPRDFTLGGESIEPMAAKDQLALDFLSSLTDEQKQQAIIGDRRANLVAGAGRDGRIPEPVGLACQSLSGPQRAKLKSVIQLYAGDMPPPHAERRMAELVGEIDQMTFGWWGPAETGGDYSYRLQGPSLIIEYAGQDLGGDPHDHLHSIYRDPTNEYGARLSE